MPLPITVVICTMNRAESLARTLPSVLAEDPVAVVLVDQSTTDASKRLVDEIADTRLKYVHTNTPGLSRAYNIGIRTAETEVLAFTDDDCTVPPGWLRAIQSVMDGNPDAAMVYGQVRAGTMPMNPGDYIPALTFSEVRRFDRGARFEIFGMGANFAARRAEMLAVGGFDEALGGGGIFRSSQDSDMQLRLWRAGKTVLAHPGFVVDHFGLRTPVQWKGTARAYGFGDGAFLVKHVRLRDGSAFRLLSRRAFHETALPLVRAARRRGYSPEYALGLLQGVRAGLRHPIDRQSRKYILNAR